MAQAAVFVVSAIYNQELAITIVVAHPKFCINFEEPSCVFWVFR